MRVLAPMPAAALVVALVSASPLCAQHRPHVDASAPSPRAHWLSRAEVHAPHDAVCLPVVAADCGCVYACGIGWPTPGSPQSFQIRHAFWNEGHTALSGRVARWCAEGSCTPALHAAIVCDGICRARAADATCHWHGDVCEGAPSH